MNLLVDGGKDALSDSPAFQLYMWVTFYFTIQGCACPMTRSRCHQSHINHCISGAGNGKEH